MAHAKTLLKVNSIGDRMMARCKVTMSTYATPGEAITAASLGLRYIEDLMVFSAPNAAGISARAVVSAGAAVITFYDEDNTSGVEAELADGAYTGVVNILAIGF